jgi:CheY-like chemotaxis protein
VEAGKNKRNTRFLNQNDSPKAVPRGTGPLDYFVPWVIELRIVGTASVIQIEIAEATIIGRSDKDKRTRPEIDLGEFDGYNMGVSRQHAVISARNSRITIRDTASANGTFINGARLQPDVEYRLRHGDHLTIGRLQFQVFFVVTPSSYEKNDTPFADISIPLIGSGQRVLIVDDDEGVARAIGKVLVQAGFNAIHALSVSDAITLIDRECPSAVVTELILPDMSGLELVSYVRRLPQGHSLPLMVVTGAAGGYQMGKAIEAGADIFLTKPVGADELVQGFTKIVHQM